MKKILLLVTCASRKNVRSTKKKYPKYQSDKQIDSQNCYLGRVWTQDLYKLIERAMDFHSRTRKSFAENEKDLIL